jgi:hypothetical protein
MYPEITPQVRATIKRRYEMDPAEEEFRGGLGAFESTDVVAFALKKGHTGVKRTQAASLRSDPQRYGWNSSLRRILLEWRQRHQLGEPISSVWMARPQRPTEFLTLLAAALATVGSLRAMCDWRRRCSH